MAETTVNQQRPTDGNTILADFRTWVAGQSHALESWAHFNNGMMKGANDLSQEIITFLQRRFQADMDVWKMLTSCRNPNEMLECQRDFAETATKEYLEEAKKLTTHVIDMVSSVTASFRPEQFPLAGNGRGGK
jgi:hypothetical protein